MNDKNAAVTVGEELHGFTIREVRPIVDLRAVAYRAEHATSGAQLLHIAAQDNENLFSITFPTVPWDDCGAAHVLEHSVLGGSRKYPVRQPFFEMIKMSMGTFINAMTASDFTTYPVSSTVHQDLFNLADVYFDAVFHPLLTEETFLREGHRLAPVDPEKPTGALQETGVVFNEMKGYFSKPEVRLHWVSIRNLLPKTIFARTSGGDPEAIPDLTYDGLKRFYQTYYHPSDAIFVTYGDIPLAEHLAFLDQRLQGFTRRPVDLSLTRQPRWSEPRRITAEYQVDDGGSTDSKTYLLLQWVAGDATDPQERMAFEVLDWILDGNEAAPLRKALADSRLGQAETGTGTGTAGPDIIYQVGLKGSEVDRGDRFERLVLDTLRRVAESEIPEERVEAAFHQAAYRHLEIPSQFPIHISFAVVEAWRLGLDPLVFIAERQHLEACHAQYRADRRFFNRLIRERLLDNPHRLLTILRPSPDYQMRIDRAFGERMRAVRARLDDAAVERIAAVAGEVERNSGTPNPPEAVALLPQLSVRDVPPRPRHVPTETEVLSDGIEFLRNDVFTNGINYLQLDLDASALTQEQWLYVPSYVNAVHQLGAAGMDYESIAARVSASTGGIGCWPVLGRTASGDVALRRMRFSLRALDDQMEDALRVLFDLILAVDPHDGDRLAIVLDEAFAERRSALINGGTAVARRFAARVLDHNGQLWEWMYGIPQLRLLSRMQRSFAQEGERVMERIDGIRDALQAGGLVASFTGSDRSADIVRQALRSWSGRPVRHQGASREEPITEGSRRTALAGPLQVAYCAEVMPAPRYTHPDSPFLSVGAHLVTTAYLLPEVRFRGAAYGGSFSYDALSGEIALLSWQDPHVVRTLGVFDATEAYVRQAPWVQVDVDRAIIATLKDGEQPIRPAEATGMALHRHIAGLTPEMRDARHAMTLSATPEGVRRAIMDALEEGRAQSSVCVVAGRSMLEEANRELRDRQAELQVEELLPGVEAADSATS